MSTVKRAVQIRLNGISIEMGVISASHAPPTVHCLQTKDKNFMQNIPIIQKQIFHRKSYHTVIIVIRLGKPSLYHVGKILFETSRGRPLAPFLWK